MSIQLTLFFLALTVFAATVAPAGSASSGAAPGSPGATSSPGSPGSPGSPSSPGSPGATSSPGSPGATSSPGSPNSPGATSSPGSPGATSSPGSPGATSSPGSPGSPGATSSPGSPGATSILGSPGATSSPGSPGATSSPGSLGATPGPSSSDATPGPASSAGERCGRYQCIDKAACVNNKCECQAPYAWGDGTFQCYRKNAVAAELKNDPSLTNFNNESLPFPYPCRYLVTHVSQQLKDNDKNVIGKCEFKVYAFNAKAKGKFYTHGFDVATKIMYDSGRVVKLSSRNYGIAQSGSYRFWRKGTNGEYSPDGPWGSDNVEFRDTDNGIRVRITENTNNNQLVYDFRRCGVTVTFVPYDVVARRSQLSVPGLSVAINCAMKPEWHGYDRVMGLAPVMGGGATFSDLRMSGINDEQSMVVRAYTREFVQNQPYDDNGQCAATSAAFKGCSSGETQQAIENCYWIMKAPRFVRCYDKSDSARKLSRLFSSCVEMWCGSGDCSQVQQMIRDSKCANTKRVPQLPRFLAGQMCPP